MAFEHQALKPSEVVERLARANILNSKVTLAELAKAVDDLGGDEDWAFVYGKHWTCIINSEKVR